MSLVLAGGLLRGGDVGGRKRKEGTSLNLTKGHISVGHEVVELVHEVLGY
jgi:hypothetical protein